MKVLLQSAPLTAWIESQVGPYPFSSTGGVVTALSPGFALETQTRPVYPVIGPDSRQLIVHELAHQWFGDSVSVDRWRDIWLNEGFATFMGERWVEATGGRSADQWLSDTYDAFRDNAAFWKLPIDDPGPDRVFDYAVYIRGAMALQALRNRIGEDRLLDRAADLGLDPGRRQRLASPTSARWRGPSAARTSAPSSTPGCTAPSGRRGRRPTASPADRAGPASIRRSTARRPGRAGSDVGSATPRGRPR